MPASSLKYVFFFFSLSTSISFCVRMCRPPFFSLPSLYVVVLFYFLQRPERTLCRLLMERT